MTKRHKVNDEMLLVREIADRAGVGITAVRKRIASGISGADLLAPRVAPWANAKKRYAKLPENIAPIRVTREEAARIRNEMKINAQ